MTGTSPESEAKELDLFSPCPGCNEIGFSIRTWHDGVQQMQCDNDDCRVNEYDPQVIEQ